jgi:hypothetical protein
MEWIFALGIIGLMVASAGFRKVVLVLLVLGSIAIASLMSWEHNNYVRYEQERTRLNSSSVVNKFQAESTAP